MAEKMTCPACNAHLSSVWSAFQDGEPCPNCGLPHDAAVAFLAAEKRGADQALIDSAAAAERRAATAEAEVQRLKGKLQRIRWELENDDGD